MTMRKRRLSKRNKTKVFYDRSLEKAVPDEFMEIFCAGGSLHEKHRNNVDAWSSPSRGVPVYTYHYV